MPTAIEEVTLDQTPLEDCQQKKYPRGYPLGFIVFHNANPGVYEAIVAHARLLKSKGAPSVGMRYLFEHERAHGQHRESKAQFGLNNNWSTSYGDLVDEQEDDLRGFIRKRKKEGCDPRQLGMDFE